MGEPQDEKPRPAPFDEGAVTPRDDVRVSGLRCPFCHEDVAIDGPALQPWVACARCLGRHHAACWDEAGRCGACTHDVPLASAPRAADAIASAYGQGRAERSGRGARPALIVGVVLSLMVAMLVAGGLAALLAVRPAPPPPPLPPLPVEARPLESARRLEGPGAVVVDDGRGRWVAVLSHDVRGDPTGLAFGEGARVVRIDPEGVVYRSLDDGGERAVAAGMTGVTLVRVGALGSSGWRHVPESRVPPREVLRLLRETAPGALDVEALRARCVGDVR